MGDGWDAHVRTEHRDLARLAGCTAMSPRLRRQSRRSCRAAGSGLQGRLAPGARRVAVLKGPVLARHLRQRARMTIPADPVGHACRRCGCRSFDDLRRARLPRRHRPRHRPGAHPAWRRGGGRHLHADRSRALLRRGPRAPRGRDRRRPSGPRGVQTRAPSSRTTPSTLHSGGASTSTRWGATRRASWTYRYTLRTRNRGLTWAR
jgi:hypothetical protein